MVIASSDRSSRTRAVLDARHRGVLLDKFFHANSGTGARDGGIVSPADHDRDECLSSKATPETAYGIKNAVLASSLVGGGRRFSDTWMTGTIPESLKSGKWTFSRGAGRSSASMGSAI